MKIFVSYSRRDAGDFANQINRHLSSFKYDIFTDVDDIRAGEIWSNTITTNISNCDIFVVIVTRGALQSPHVQREVLQAQRENKKIIPCFFRKLNQNKIKWGLDKIQGVEFSDKYELARELDSKIDIDTNISSDKGTESISGSTSKTLEDKKTDTMSATKSDIVKTVQKKEDLNPILKGRIGALGSGFPSVPSMTADDEKTTKSEVDKLEPKKDRPELPPKVTKDDKVQSGSSGDIVVDGTKKEENENRKYSEGDSSKKSSQGIFGSASKTVEDTKTLTNTIKSNSEEIHQKKDKLSLSNLNTGAIGGGSGVPSPKYTALESDNNERIYTERNSSSRQPQGINLKLIFIPIIAVAIIGLIISVSYFNSIPSPTPKPIDPEITSPSPKTTPSLPEKVEEEVTSKLEPPKELSINKVPVANAGVDKTVNAGEYVLVDASASSDFDGTITSYLWEQVEGPAVSLIYNSNEPLAYFYAPSNITTDTILKFSLIVTDNNGAKSNADILTFNVKPY